MKRKLYRLKTFLLEFFAGDPEFWQTLDRNAVLYDKTFYFRNTGLILMRQLEIEPQKHGSPPFCFPRWFVLNYDLKSRKLTILQPLATTRLKYIIRLSLLP